MHTNGEYLNEIFLTNLLENLPSHVFWKNKEGVYLGCNSNFARSIGLNVPADVVGKTDYELPVSHEDSNTYRTDDQEVMASQQPKFNIEEKQLLKNGKEIFLLTSKVPLFDNDNNVIGILGVYSDITELKNAQLSLLDAKKKAELASQAKTEFIANMSHDFRTPIAGVIGMVQNLLNIVETTENSLQKETSPNKKLLNELICQVKDSSYILMNSTESLLHLCNEILEVTRLENGIVDQSLKPFDIYDLVQQNINLLKPVSLSKNVSLISHIDNTVPRYLEGFMEYTNRIFLNLISNALKFTEKGQVRIDLGLVEDKKINYKKGDVVKVQIKIIDTGIGIPEDKFDNIFKQFSRLTSSCDGIYQGSGLGLYIVKKYVEKMDGNIQLESKVGQGTCFTITLPFTVSDKVDNPRIPNNYLNKTTCSISLDDENSILFNSSNSKNSNLFLHQILVVEDNAPAAVAIKFALKPLHCAIDFAASGREAIDKVKNNMYELILMDVGLPDMNGIKVTKEVRALKDPSKAQIPIIALTGHADNPEMREECLKSGMQDILIKPTQTRMLEPIFEKYIIAKKIDDQLNDAESKSLDKTIIDWDECVNMSYGDKSTAYKMLSMIATDLVTTLITLEKHYVEKNIEGLRVELHRTLGGIVYVCLPKLEKTLRDFQIVIQSESLDSKKLEQTYEIFKNVVSEFKEEWESQDNVVHL